MNLCGKKILLGITGGIAAYKSCELLRLLQKEGAEVRVAMTPNAAKFVAPLTFASLSKCPVFTESGSIEARPFQHIDFPQWADLFLVAPCSANMLGKMANGLADDPVSLCFMACRGPKWIAPAMNTVMFESPAVVENLKKLESFKNTEIHILRSPEGELACGEVGAGRMAEPQEILAELKRTPEKVLLKSANNHLKIVITAGRTEEPIDPVRYISNRSGGQTAVALAEAFLNAGFQVIVVQGIMEARLPSNCQIVSVRSACEMHEAVLREVDTAAAVVHCAAVADYRPVSIATEKIKDSRNQLILELCPNPNILRDTVAKRNACGKSQVIVGFALETADAVRHAEEKLKKSGADLLVLNTPVAKNSGFGFNTVAFSLVKPNQPILPPQLGSKKSLAEQVVCFVSEKLAVNHESNATETL